MENEMLKQILTEIMGLRQEFNDFKQEVRERFDRLEARVDALEQKVDALEQNVVALEQNVVALAKDLAETKTHVLVLRDIADTDYDLLQKVNKKVDALSSVTSRHEQRFQYLKAI